MQHCSTHDQVADGFIKALHQGAFEKSRDKLGVKKSTFRNKYR